jgi:hypothetical protein
MLEEKHQLYVMLSDPVSLDNRALLCVLCLNFATFVVKSFRAARAKDPKISLRRNIPLEMPLARNAPKE